MEDDTTMIQDPEVDQLENENAELGVTGEPVVLESDELDPEDMEDEDDELDEDEEDELDEEDLEEDDMDEEDEEMPQGSDELPAVEMEEVVDE
jgi:hypothetical protein